MFFVINPIRGICTCVIGIPELNRGWSLWIRPGSTGDTFFVFTLGNDE